MIDYQKEKGSLSGVGFEPTPPFGDQNTVYQSHDGKGLSPWVCRLRPVGHPDNTLLNGLEMAENSVAFWTSLNTKPLFADKFNVC